MLSTPNMGLIVWNLPTDPYNSEELAENLIKCDLHDHTEGKGARITTASIEDGAITAAKLHPSTIAEVINIQTITGSVAGATSKLLTWPSTFGDTDYEVFVSTSAAAGAHWVGTKTATQVTIHFPAAYTGDVTALGVHN